MLTNNQKIELVQANKAQLLESCKQCLNCTAWVPELTDWDVMQSGYSEKQLYPQVLEVLEMHDVPCTTRVYEERAEIEQLKKQLTDLKSKNKALHALCRMRATIVTAEKWNSLRPHIKRAIKLLDRKEKALLASENNG